MGVMNWLVLLTVWVYTAINIFLVCKELISDIKTPFLGISSSHIFIYFIACLVNLLQFCFIFKASYFSTHNIYVFYICNLVASYYCTIFLIKKFAFNSIKMESILTLFLGLCLYISLTLIIILRDTFESAAPVMQGLFIEKYYTLVCGMSVEYVKSKMVFISRVIPILTLLGMWFYSVTKPYNKNELNFFPKSANKPLILFMLYEFIIMILPSINLPTVLDKYFIIVILLGLRLWFQVSLLHWLRHKDMEKIETSMLARSKKEPTRGVRKW